MKSVTKNYYIITTRLQYNNRKQTEISALEASVS